MVHKVNTDSSVDFVKMKGNESYFWDLPDFNGQWTSQHTLLRCWRAASNIQARRNNNCLEDAQFVIAYEASCKPKKQYRMSPHFVIFGTKRVSRNSGITNFETLFSAKSQIGSKKFLKSTFSAFLSWNFDFFTLFK